MFIGIHTLHTVAANETRKSSESDGERTSCQASGWREDLLPAASVFCFPNVGGCPIDQQSQAWQNSSKLVSWLGLGAWVSFLCVSFRQISFAYFSCKYLPKRLLWFSFVFPFSRWHFFHVSIICFGTTALLSSRNSNVVLGHGLMEKKCCTDCSERVVGIAVSLKSCQLI